MIIIQYLLLAQLLLCYPIQKNFAQSLEKDAAILLKEELPALKKSFAAAEIHFIPTNPSGKTKMLKNLKEKPKIPLKEGRISSVKKWLAETENSFKTDFAKKDTIEQVQILGNVAGPTNNMLPKSSGLRNHTKETISALQVTALAKDLIFEETTHDDPVHILKRIVWAINPTLDLLMNGPEKVALTSFVMGANALHIMTTERDSFAKKTIINKLRKLVDDFVYNIAELLAPGPLKDAHYAVHRGIHTAAFAQNYKNIYALGPKSEDALRSLGNTAKTLPDGPFKQILREVIGGLRSLAIVRNPW
jgi:hypothetical protein